MFVVGTTSSETLRGECIEKEKRKVKDGRKKLRSSMDDGYRQQAETTSPSDTRNSVRFATERKSVYRAARCRVPREENSTGRGCFASGLEFHVGERSGTSDRLASI